MESQSLAYHAIHPTAKPTLSSTNREQKSIIGPLTGKTAVISPRLELADQITTPRQIVNSHNTVVDTETLYPSESMPK